jgi:hypothetical protein
VGWGGGLNWMDREKFKTRLRLCLFMPPLLENTVGHCGPGLFIGYYYGYRLSYTNNNRCQVYKDS